MKNKIRNWSWTIILTAALTLSLIPVYPIVDSYAADTLATEVPSGSFVLPVDQKNQVPDGYIGVSTKEDLYQIRDGLSSDYILMDDIVFTAEDFDFLGTYYNGNHGWLPIGDETTPFTGTFDGNGHTITGLHSEENVKQDVGLFGRLGNGAQILNLGMVGCDIWTTQHVVFTGTVAGYVDSGATISNCYNTGVTSGTNAPFETYTGGIAGGNDGTITYCNNTGKAATNYVTFGYVGGIIGFNSGTVSQCYNTGQVLVTYASGCAAGIAGKNSGVVDECYNTGKVRAETTGITSSGRTAMAGGIAGVVTATGTVQNTLNTGLMEKSALSTTEYSGGIAAVNDGALETSYSIGLLYRSGGLQTGSIAGTSSGLVESCYRYERFGYTTFGTALTLAGLQQSDSYAGFDFAGTWSIDPDAEYPAPTLRSLGTPKFPNDIVNFSGGDGSIFNPYLLSKASDLLKMWEHPLSNFRLTSDITGTDTVKTFKGFDNFHGWFEGNGYRISGISVTPIAGSYYAGLCGHVMEGAEVRNLKLDIIVASNTSIRFAGAFAGAVSEGGLVANCINESDISAKASIGGICGANDGTIINGVNYGNLACLATSVGQGGNVQAGGIAGANSGVLENPVNYGAVDVNYGTFERAGGICAGNSGQIFGAINYGPVSLTTHSFARCGGITGNNQSDGSAWIKNSTNEGDVTVVLTPSIPDDVNYSYTGGIAGYTDSLITLCDNNGSVTATGPGEVSAMAAGIAGFVHAEGKVIQNYNTGNISGKAYAGGIVAFTNGYVKENYNTGKISGEKYIGGLIGYYRTGWIDDCYTLGNIPYSEYAGDIAGEVDPDTGGVPGDNYYLDETGTGGEGALTEEELAQQSAYAGFDFQETWMMSPTLKKPVHKKNLPNTFSIKYVLNGGALPSSAASAYMLGSYNRLATPKRNGYTFMGWYGTPDFSGSKVSVIPIGSKTNKTYYAKWAAPISSAASYNYNSVKISWAAAGNVSSYRIYRATSATGTYSLIKIADSTARSYVNTGLVTGKTYYYKVSVVAGGKTYHHSAYKSAKSIPATPTVALSKYSSTSIKVSWSAVTGATKYQIFRASSATGSYTYLYTASSTARSWVNTGLTRGKTYYYKVRAYHLEGTTKVYGISSAVKYLKI